jgi:hypothetical protein
VASSSPGLWKYLQRTSFCYGASDFAGSMLAFNRRSVGSTESKRAARRQTEFSCSWCSCEIFFFGPEGRFGLKPALLL